MLLVIQRVQQAQVSINNEIYSEIGSGLLVLLGIHQKDQASVIPWLVQKLIHLRIFSDEQGKMNLSAKELNKEILVVSQFTLYGNCLNGRRPDFLQAAPPIISQPIYNQFVDILKQEIEVVKTGVFGANMQIGLINDGPVTLLIDSDKKNF